MISHFSLLQFICLSAVQEQNYYALICGYQSDCYNLGLSRPPFILAKAGSYGKSIIGLLLNVRDCQNYLLSSDILFLLIPHS
jgi:hypothetical protein